MDLFWTAALKGVCLFDCSPLKCLRCFTTKFENCNNDGC